MESLITTADVLDLLRQHVALYGTQKAAAATYGISEPYFSEILSGRRDPSKKILARLNLRQVIRYEVVREAKND